MKAIVYQQYGPPEVLHVAEVEKPTPTAEDVLIRVRAVEATKTDCEFRSFKLPVKWTWLPLRLATGITKPRQPILGMYFAGEIETVGSAVTSYKPGDTIFGCTGFDRGAYAEYVCLPESATLVPMPHNMSFAEAAAIPLGALNALHYMRRANIQPGEQVLITGAGGSIGNYAVQIAKAFGAEVTGVDGPHKRAMVMKLGADHYIDYTKTDFLQMDQSYDVIFDMVTSTPYSKCLQRLNPNGRYLLGNPRFFKMLRSAITTRFTDKTVLFAFAGETEAELHALKEMIEAGQLVAPLDGVYTMTQAAEAHHRVETEQRVGVVVLQIGD